MFVPSRVFCPRCSCPSSFLRPGYPEKINDRNPLPYACLHSLGSHYADKFKTFFQYIIYPSSKATIISHLGSRQKLLSGVANTIHFLLKILYLGSCCSAGVRSVCEHLWCRGLQPLVRNFWVFSANKVSVPNAHCDFIVHRAALPDKKM